MSREHILLRFRFVKLKTAVDCARKCQCHPPSLLSVCGKSTTIISEVSAICEAAILFFYDNFIRN